MSKIDGQLDDQLGVALGEALHEARKPAMGDGFDGAQPTIRALAGTLSPQERQKRTALHGWF